MMRGPVAYDDGYISRKMSQLQTQPPPMAAPQPGYGRPPPPGYMQSGFEATPRGRARSLGRPKSMVDPAGLETVQMHPRSRSSVRSSSLARGGDAGPRMAGTGALPAGSLSAGAMQHVRQLNQQIRQQQQNPPEKDAFITPYLWPESDIGAKKGWYRVDFGPDRKTEHYFLPNPSDRLNFLTKRSVSPAPHLTTMDSPLITSPQVRQPMKQKADLFADNVQAETVAMKIEGGHRSSHRHRMLDDVVSRAKCETDGYSTRKSYYWQVPHFRGLATRRTASLPRRWSMFESCPVHGTAVNTCSTRAEDDTEIDEGGYPPMAAAPPMRRLPPPPPPPMYYDYDYGYGGGYDYYGGGYAYPPPPPQHMGPPPMQRMSRYEQYMEEDPELAGMASAGQMAPRQSLRPRTPPQVPTPIKGRGEMPPTSMAEFDQREAMLQDHVDKMRIRLKSLAYSLDPTGPVPEIVIPERSGAIKPTSVESAEDSKKKHTMALEYKEMPNLSTRRSARTYPEDEYMKDNLRIKCLSHYKTTRTAADYWRPKLSNVSITDGTTTDAALPESYASKYTSKYQTKWEEPDTIYGSSSDKKPFSKVETGSSFFSTYGYTNRKKDSVAEKVRDYYYGIEDKEPMAEICPAPEPPVERKKSKSKKTKEEPVAVEAAPAAPAAEEPVSISAVSDSALAEESMDPEADEKEKKKLEKKKRKAEREAAAKAAMEAELAALAAAEAELARLEQESASLATPAAPADEPAAPVEIPAVEVQSESAADKCESSSFSGGIVGVSVSGEEPPQQVTVQVVPEPMVTEEPPQVVEPPTPVLVAPAPPPEEEQQQPADSTAAAEPSQ